MTFQRCSASPRSAKTFIVVVIPFVVANVLELSETLLSSVLAPTPHLLVTFPPFFYSLFLTL